jgi:hypothetical protein
MLKKARRLCALHAIEIKTIREPKAAPSTGARA